MKHVVLWAALTAFLLGIFETAILSHLSFLPMLPDLILVLLVYVALFNGTVSGVVVGFCSGLVFDFLSSAPFGLHAFIFTPIGFLYGTLYRKYNISRFVFPFVLGFSATVFKALLLFGVRFLFGQGIQVYNMGSFHFWFEAVFTACCAPVLFSLLGLFPHAFQKREV